MLEEVLSIKPAFTDKRGLIYNVLGHPIEHVAVIVTHRGAVRGNHVHEREIQYCYILRGRVRCEAVLVHSAVGDDLDLVALQRETAVLDDPDEETREPVGGTWCRGAGGGWPSARRAFRWAVSPPSASRRRTPACPPR